MNTKPFSFDASTLVVVVVEADDVGPELDDDCIDDLADEEELSPRRLSPDECSGEVFEVGQTSVDNFSFMMSSVTTEKQNILNY